MEVVFRQVPCFSSNSIGDASNSRHVQSFSQSRWFCPKQQSSRKSLIASAGCDGFSDKSHLNYYDYSSGPSMAIKEKEITSKKKDMKKQLKLMKGLANNLASFSDMGFGLNLDNGLDEQVREKMISEATEILVGQLQKLKAEKMELKRRKKEEKAKKKAAKMMDCKRMDEESSSSSSSSESECEKVSQVASSNVIVSHGEETTTTTTKASCSSLLVGEVEKEMKSGKSLGDNKIEVCMGGKCKKSGAAVLLENFQKAVGTSTSGEVAQVVGCKCMGKCRDGPNVKVVVNGNDDDKSNSNPLPLYMGVGLEDVDSIINNYLFGRNTMVNPTTAPAL